MDGMQADSLTKALASMWPAWNLNLRQWSKNMADLEYKTASKAVSTIVRQSDNPPSWARFLLVYDSCKGQAITGPACELCSGTGWVTDTDHPNHYPGPVEYAPKAHEDGCFCNVVKACRCTLGQTVATDIHRRIVREREARSVR